jgi:carbamoyl-phosphate synthase large subunit
MNVLLTGINGDIGSGAYNIIARRSDVELIVGTDITDYRVIPINQKSIYVRVPHSKNQKIYLLSIMEIVDKYDIGLIIPTTENEIKLIKNSIQVNEKKIKILTHEVNEIEIFFSKRKTMDALREKGISHGKFFDSQNYENELNFPFFLKKNYSSGGEGVFKINNHIDLRYYSKKFPDSILQEDLGEGPEYTISVFSTPIFNEFVAFERCLGYGGVSKWVKTVDKDLFSDLVDSLQVNFGFKGSYNVQLMSFGESLFIFEINLRLSSTLSIRHKIGFQDLNWWIDYMIYGKSPTKYKIEYGKKEYVRLLKDYEI